MASTRAEGGRAEAGTKGPCCINSSHSLEENKNYDIPQRLLPSGSVLSNKKLGHKASHFLVQPHVDTQSE